MLALLTKFLAREAELVVISAKGQALETVPRGTGRLLVFPGSFEPLHEGHTKLAEAARAATKRRDAEEPSLLYEISLKNADKMIKPSHKRVGPIASKHNQIIFVVCTPFASFFRCAY